MSNNAEMVKNDNSGKRDCENCSKLQNVISALKDVASLRKSLLEMREMESKDLMEKLKVFEVAVEDERNQRIALTNRVKSAEERCSELTLNYQKRTDRFGVMQESYETKISGLLADLDKAISQLTLCKEQLDITLGKNEQLNKKMCVLEKLINTLKKK